MRQRQQFFRILSYVFLIVSSFIMVYPMLFMVLGVFTTPDKFFDSIFLPIPNTLNTHLFVAALKSGVWDSYIFTLIRVGFYLVVTLVVGLLGGYIFSKMKFPGKNKIFLFFLSGMVMPAILMLVPQYLMMAWWPFAGGNNWLGQGGHGFIEDWKVLFILGWVPVFAIFILKQSMDALPTEYEDAAKIDGAGMFTIIFRIYGPLLKPPLVALTIIVFIGVWNDFLWASLTVSGHPDWYPIGLRMQQVMIGNFSPYGVIDYPALFVKTFLGTWPPALVYFLLQRYFVQGLVSSGLKG